ncbi:MAG: hypothetical protein NTX25_23490, partial [Proteobacteria bacterium]|nr:hypothetical protein [Pseudomonadota bacterium]
MKTKGFFFAIYIILLCCATAARAYDCSNCDDQCASVTFGKKWTNPLCRNACLLEQFKCTKVDWTPLCVGSGPAAMEAGKMEISVLNAELPTARMDDAAK